MNVILNHLAELTAIHAKMDDGPGKAVIANRIDHAKSCIEYEEGIGPIRWTGWPEIPKPRGV
jgi:hypothetical protein